MIYVKNGWDVAHLVMHSSFDELQQASELCRISINVEDIDAVQCFFVGGEVRQRQIASRKYLVKTTVLFQAGMESLISYWQSKYPEIQDGSNFVKKWEKAFESKGSAAQFDEYASFYRSVRIAVIHPETQERINTINSLRYLQVYKGIQRGWEASERLADALGEPYDDNSWEIMCNAHGVPPQALDNEYPDLAELSSELYKRHLSELNRLNEQSGST